MIDRFACTAIIVSAFRNLKSLKISEKFTFYYEAFVDCTSLESLEINFDEVRYSAWNAIRTSLKSNDGLKMLTLHQEPLSYGGRLFDEDFSTEINFKLSKFCALELRLKRSTSFLNFIKFLRTQSDSLETLCIKSCELKTIALLETFISMVRLKKLVLIGCDDHYYNREPIVHPVRFFRQNFSVVYLDLSKFRTDVGTLDIILESFPNVETLKMSEER